MSLARILGIREAGADSIDDMDLLRHGAMPVVLGGIRAPSTLGSFLRSLTWGNGLQLGKVQREVLAGLPAALRCCPVRTCWRSSISTPSKKRVYGHAKHGAAFGFNKIQGKGLLVRGLNVLAATICTPLAAPVIAGTRLRGGNASSVRGAASMISEAVATARAAGCAGTLVARMDSALYGAPAVWAARRAGAHFSVAVRMDPKIRAAIAAIGDDAWTPVRYPRRLDDQLRCWVSDAAVAEVEHTAFASRKGQAITARLIVRRVRDRNAGQPAGQGELFTAWRYHAVFRDSPFQTLQAEDQHCGHAQAEQVLAHWTDGPLAHLRSGSFPANAGWLALAAISCNLLCTTAAQPRTPPLPRQRPWTSRTTASSRKTTPIISPRSAFPGQPTEGDHQNSRVDRGLVPRIALRDKLPFPVHSKVILTRDGVVLSFVPSFHSVQPCELL